MPYAFILRRNSTVLALRSTIEKLPYGAPQQDFLEILSSKIFQKMKNYAEECKIFGDAACARNLDERRDRAVCDGMRRCVNKPN
ncbi:MAG: hypothetical protein V4724_00635 [Pseudomonadota bacterium]